MLENNLLNNNNPKTTTRVSSKPGQVHDERYRFWLLHSPAGVGCREQPVHALPENAPATLVVVDEGRRLDQ